VASSGRMPEMTNSAVPTAKAATARAKTANGIEESPDERRRTKSRVGGRSKFGAAAGGEVLDLGVEGGAENENLRGIVEPEQQDDGGGDRAEGGLVVAEVLDVDREDHPRRQPEQRGEGGA